MKSFAFLSALAILSIASVQAGPADDVKAAAKQLAEKGGYSWTTTTESATGGGRRFGPTEGKVGKDGLMHIKTTAGANTIEAVVHGSKRAIKTQDGWQTPDELSDGGGGQGGGRFFSRRLMNTKPPADEAQDLVTHARNLTMTDGAYAGELTEQGVRSLLSFGRGGGGGGGAEVSNGKGKVKFWVKDGLLTKYEYQVQGTMSFGGNERDIDRTTTVEIKNVGSTTVTVPEEAKRKLS
jgi:hypothetical protein